MITNRDGLEHSYMAKHHWTTWKGDKRERNIKHKVKA